MRTAARVIVVKDDSLLVMHRNKFGHEYYALVGGGVDYGETDVEALYREVEEETGIIITNHRLVIIEDAGSMYGIQYIYLCDYVRGEPSLNAQSMEAKINAGGQNLYNPQWLPIARLPTTNLLPIELRDILVMYLKQGFPHKPLEIKIQQ